MAIIEALKLFIIIYLPLYIAQMRQVIFDKTWCVIYALGWCEDRQFALVLSSFHIFENELP